MHFANFLDLINYICTYGVNRIIIEVNSIYDNNASYYKNA